MLYAILSPVKAGVALAATATLRSQKRRGGSLAVCAAAAAANGIRPSGAPRRWRRRGRLRRRRFQGGDGRAQSQGAPRVDAPAWERGGRGKSTSGM